MTLYASGYKEVDVDLEIEDEEIIQYIREDEKRLAMYRENLKGCGGGTAREILDSMTGLDRDAFLADLCRECALLRIEWPADPKDETTTINRPDREHA